MPYVEVGDHGPGPHRGVTTQDVHVLPGHLAADTQDALAVHRGPVRGRTKDAASPRRRSEHEEGNVRSTVPVRPKRKTK